MWPTHVTFIYGQKNITPFFTSNIIIDNFAVTLRYPGNLFEGTLNSNVYQMM
jgi:hypothetical protein